MKISSVMFKNYKSFIQSQTLKTDSNLVTIVGQNGSGKTNFLDALYVIFNPQLVNNHDIDFQMNIQLSDSDILMFKNHIVIDEDNRNLVAYFKPTKSMSPMTINRVKAPAIVNSLKREKGDINSLGKQLSNAISLFQEDLKLFDDKQSWPLTLRVKIDNVVENQMPIRFLLDSINRKLSQLDDQINKIIEIVSDDILVIPEAFFYSAGPNYYIDQFEIVYQALMLAEFEKKYITIHEDGLKEAIAAINSKFTSHRDKIFQLIKELSEKMNYVSSLVDTKESLDHRNDDLFMSLYSDIIKVTNPKVYYIGSENNRVLFPDRQGNHRALISHSYEERNIINSFLKRFHKTIDSDARHDLDISKISIDDKRKLVIAVQQYLNQNLLTCEKLNIQGIEIDTDLNFYVHEMTDQRIPLSETNAGRKWYISFLIIKSLMEEDDILLLDEPAANLHPSAQVEVLSEIEHLAENHKVILTTHSPYLVSSKSSVYQVSMTKEGSIIEQRCNLDLYNLLAKYNPDLSSSFGDLIIRNLLPLSDVARNVKAELKRLGKKPEEVMRVLCINDVNNYNRKMRGKNFTYNDLITIVDKFMIDPRKVLFR